MPGTDDEYRVNGGSFMIRPSAPPRYNLMSAVTPWVAPSAAVHDELMVMH